MIRPLGQAALAAFLIGAGVLHLTVLREEFQALVPTWVPLDADFVVVASGVVEIAVGLLVALSWRHPRRAIAGIVAALLFVAVFPGNVDQYLQARDGMRLDSDSRRFIRLFFQPVLIVWALWSTDAVGWWRARR